MEIEEPVFMSSAGKEGQQLQEGDKLKEGMC